MFSYVATTLGLHVGDNEEDAKFKNRIQAEAKARYAGKISAFLRAAVERDLSGDTRGAPDAMSPTILVDLAKRLLGEIDAAELAHGLGNKDQPKKLRVMLQRILCEEFDLDLPSPQIAKHTSDARFAEMAGENFLHYIARRRDIAGDNRRATLPAPALMVADKQASDQAGPSKPVQAKPNHHPRRPLGPGPGAS